MYSGKYRINMKKFISSILEAIQAIKKYRTGPGLKGR
jgi:hypothetical protein